MDKKISLLSRAIIAGAAIVLAISIFVPIWRIELAAPQYPEGLVLKIFANKLGGDVEIINGLNHYIGMKTLHENDFIEFTVLPYIIGFYVLFGIVAAITGRKKILYTLFSLFLLFGIVAMVDFWRWEYNYGHNLDPHAAIIVPGMAYQPPMIGFKQLLNFGAYSVPDIGGWLFVASGLLLLVAVVKETHLIARIRHKKKRGVAVAAVLLLSLNACGSMGPEPINFNNDQCEFCKMTISDQRFACEMVTTKNRAYKFDDVKCMMDYKNDNRDKATSASFYVSDFIPPHKLIEAAALSYIKAESLGSPMGGNTAGFSNKDSASVYQKKFSAEATAWNSINL